MKLYVNQAVIKNNLESLNQDLTKDIINIYNYPTFLNTSINKTNCLNFDQIFWIILPK